MANSEIRRTLQSWYNGGVSVDTIVNELAAIKLGNDTRGKVHAADGTTTIAQRMEAAASSKFGDRDMREALGYARSLGVRVTDEGIDPYELDEAMRKKGMSIDRRVFVKTLMANAELID